MTWLEFKCKVNETTSRLTSEAVPITFLHGDRDEAQKVLSRLLQRRPSEKRTSTATIANTVTGFLLLLKRKEILSET